MNATIKTTAQRLWYIDGKAYDLTPLLRWHPGGRDVLLACEGRECTEVFENSHAMSGKNIRALIDRYRVPDAEQGPQPAGFKFEPDGFYAELCRRVRAYFAARGGNYKATWPYWVRLYVLLAVYATVLYGALVWGSLLLAPMAGALWMLFLFYGSLHDASHQALSRKPWVNKFWSTVTAHWGLWHHELWLQHHVYGHHSYTGVADRDPDLNHLPELVRKHQTQEHRPVHRFQLLSFLLTFLVVPGQYMAQIYAYASARIRRTTLFDMPIRLRVTAFDVLPWALEVLSVLIQGVLPLYRHSLSRALLLMWLQWATSGVFYFLIVSPNHDTDATQHELREGELGDWGEHQVRSSSNFSNNNRLLTMLLGGMNYQIEHHLFPTVCNVHYPALGRITKQLCAERGVPYAQFPSLFAALRGVVRNIHQLGRRP